MWYLVFVLIVAFFVSWNNSFFPLALVFLTVNIEDKDPSKSNLLLSEFSFLFLLTSENKRSIPALKWGIFETICVLQTII